MTNTWALALGILFLCIWVAIMLYHSYAHKAYIQGRMDHIRHRNHQTDYKGLSLFLYNRGRADQAKKHRLKVHSRMEGRGYGNFIPR